MTNYTRFPSWRISTGIVIRFNDFQYSLSDDSKSQRNYLATSSYLDGSELVFICKYKTWIPTADFRQLCLADNYSVALKEYMTKHFNKKPHICPNCGMPLRIMSGKNGMFLGCTGYPSCHYTKSYSVGDMISEDALAFIK